MNTQQAIRAANALLEGTDHAGYFSPQQPAFFVEAARSAGIMHKEPYTEDEVEKTVKNAVGALDGIDAEVKRDQKMTAKTTREGRVIVNDMLDEISRNYEDQYHDNGSELLDRPLFWQIAGTEHVIIYKERWPGKKDGDDFIMPVDKIRMRTALLAWVMKYRDA